MRKKRLQLSMLVAALGAAVAAGSAAAASSPETIANASSGSWSESAYLCTPAGGSQPTAVDAADLAAALGGGSTYANSVAGSVAVQPNNTGTASLRCDVPDGATPILGSDGAQLVADNNGDLFPAAWAGLGTIGYPAYTTSSASASVAANAGVATSTATAAAAAAVLANANTGTWSGTVFLCTPAGGSQPTAVDAANLASALAGGSTYANSIASSVAVQPNYTGTASLRCDVPAGSTPIVGADGSQLVADGNGDLYPAALAGLGTVGYPAYETS